MVAMDTTEEAQQAYVAAYQGLTGSQRVEQAVEMAEMAKEIAIAGIRFRMPGISDEEVAIEWLRLLYGDDYVDSLR